jgi:hypothetical protein
MDAITNSPVEQRKVSVDCSSFKQVAFWDEIFHGISFFEGSVFFFMREPLVGWFERLDVVLVKTVLCCTAITLRLSNLTYYASTVQAKSCRQMRVKEWGSGWT